MAKKGYVVDLFSGCGGFSHGFEQAGFEVVLGVDIDQPALETFKKNHLHSMALNLDLAKDDSINLIVKTLAGKKISVIIAGPPCQGFSLTGTRDENDKRNKLFFSVFKLARILKPDFIVIENVPGIAHLYEGRAREAILAEFKRMKYQSSEKVLFAAEYGVPQIRKRMIFVGVRKSIYDMPFQFPDPILTPDKYVTCEDAIGDLPSLEHSLGAEISEYDRKPVTEFQKKMRAKSTLLYNHVGTNHSELVKEVIRMVPEGGNHKDLPPGVGDSRKFNEAWTRYHSKKPAKTIDTGHRNHFHYKYDRVPTIRENARIQSFPDHFVFLGTKTQQNKQVGNAVPPLLGKVIGEAIAEHMENNV